MKMSIDDLESQFAEAERAAGVLDDDRLRREVRASQAILELHCSPRIIDGEYQTSGGSQVCEGCGQPWSPAEGCPTVRALASAYA